MRLQYPGTIPLEAQYLYRRGIEMMGQQRADLALVYFRQAVFIAPGFSKAYIELGNCHARLGRQEEAAANYRKAAQIDSRSNAAIAAVVTN
jgi:tetratricopeptide (TPR) repeat protein